ncbi:MAG: DUF1236 domain-containing protein [Alphaproteobacteria bacterium]|nr:DUF1236 domain-containing protein [Alphaproteobacteria bacterium]
MGPRTEQRAAKQPNVQQGRQGEQRAERQRPQEQGKPAEQQAQQRDQEHKQNQAQENGKERAMNQRPSSLTSEQRPGSNPKNADSKAELKPESKTGFKREPKASQRASEERGKQRNQATQNTSQQNTAQDQDKNQKNTPNRANAQNAPAKPNATQAKENQSASKNQAQQSTQNQPAAQGNNGTNQTSQNTNQRNTASAKLSQNDRSKVISTLRSDTRGSRESVNVSLNIGERLPPRIHARPLPRTIVDIMPEYRGYDYVMVQDRVDIIDPRSHEVVDIVEEGGPTVAEGGGSFESRTFQSGRVRLTTEQRQLLFRDARPMTSSQVSSAGGTCLTEQPVPDSLASQNPDLKGYNFLKVGNDIVLIDPKDQKVIDVIQQ